MMPLMDCANQWVWHAMKLYLPVGTKLTSVYRSPQSQLDFIERTAKRKGFVFKTAPKLQDPSSWDGALQFLRSRGFHVSAPGRSMHQRGLAYDLSGPDLNKIMEAILRAAVLGRIRLVANGRPNPIVEYQNRCVHVEIEGAVLDHDPFDYA